MFPWHEIKKTWSGNSSGFYYIYSGVSVIFIQANKTCKRELALAHERVHAVAYKVYAEAYAVARSRALVVYAALRY